MNPFKWFRREAKAITSADLDDLFCAAPTQSGVAVSIETALRVPAVKAAVSTIADAAATLDRFVVEIDGETETRVEHPVSYLIQDEANEWTSAFGLIRQLVEDALCRDAGGLAYVNRVNGEPVEIIRYKPGKIQVQDDAVTGEPVYRIGGVVTPAQNIIHIRAPLGKAPLTLAREAIGVSIVMARHQAKLFGRGARPSGALKFPQGMGETAVKNTRLAWKASQEDGEWAGSTPILYDGADFEQLTFSSVDSQFQQLLVHQIQEIARAFNMPGSMIGDLTKSNYNTLESKNREFLSYTLEPWLQEIEGAFRRALFLPEDRKRYAIRFDRDDLSRADLTARATAISSLISAKVINPNEARSWLGYGPYAGGAEFANPHINVEKPDAEKPGNEPEDDEDEGDDDAT